MFHQGASVLKSNSQGFPQCGSCEISLSGLFRFHHSLVHPPPPVTKKFENRESNSLLLKIFPLLVNDIAEENLANLCQNLESCHDVYIVVKKSLTVRNHLYVSYIF